MELSGLLLPLEWVIAGGFWRTLGTCLVICPGIPQLLGLVCCSYWAPWSGRDQFKAYIPGNPILAVFIAGTSTTFDRGHVHVWTWLNAVSLVLALGFWGFLTWGDRKIYTRGQMWSANKLYHNALYFWYGYLAFICAVGMWFWTDASLLHKAVVTLPGLLWLWLLSEDARLGEDELKRKASTAHADNWPIWRTGYRLRRWTPQGYRLKL